MDNSDSKPNEISQLLDVLRTDDTSENEKTSAASKIASFCLDIGLGYSYWDEDYTLSDFPGLIDVIMRVLRGDIESSMSCKIEMVNGLKSLSFTSEVNAEYLSDSCFKLFDSIFDILESDGELSKLCFKNIIQVCNNLILRWKKVADRYILANLHLRVINLIGIETNVDKITLLLTQFMHLSFHPDIALVFKHAGVLNVLQDVKRSGILSEGMDLMPIVALLLIVGRDETQSTGIAFSEYIERMVELLNKIINVNNYLCAEYSYLTRFTIRLLLGCCLALSISDKNKTILVQSKILQNLLLILQSYASNSDQSYFDHDGTHFLLGGGGEDVESASLAIEVLCQLSFHFPDSTSLRSYMTKDLCVVELLEQAISLPEGRDHKLEADAIRNARRLVRLLTDTDKFMRSDTFETLSLQSLNVLKENDTISQLAKNDIDRTAAYPKTESEASSSSTIEGITSVRKHVMLSYAWGANKDLVMAFCTELKQQGFEVWRDEEGSALVGPMSGDAEDKMADAIECAHTVIVFVSRQYKYSFNCQAEAKYARGLVKKGMLKMLFVMLQSDYTTVSKPECVDGWLGFMIGQSVWYPLFDASKLSATVLAVSGEICPSAMSGQNMSVKSVESHYPKTQLLPIQVQVPELANVIIKTGDHIDVKSFVDTVNSLHLQVKEIQNQFTTQLLEKDKQSSEKEKHLFKIIGEKDRQISEKDRQISEKDKQIAQLFQLFAASCANKSSVNDSAYATETVQRDCTANSVTSFKADCVGFKIPIRARPSQTNEAIKYVKHGDIVSVRANIENGYNELADGNGWLSMSHSKVKWTNVPPSALSAVATTSKRDQLDLVKPMTNPLRESFRPRTNSLLNQGSRRKSADSLAVDSTAQTRDV